MTTFSFLVEYNCRAWIEVEADTKEEAVDMLNESVALDDSADIVNMIESDIEILKEGVHR